MVFVCVYCSNHQWCVLSLPDMISSQTKAYKHFHYGQWLHFRRLQTEKWWLKAANKKWRKILSDLNSKRDGFESFTCVKWGACLYSQSLHPSSDQSLSGTVCWFPWAYTNDYHSSDYNGQKKTDFPVLTLHMAKHWYFSERATWARSGCWGVA